MQASVSDQNSDGILDRISVRFSENMASTVVSSGWTIGNAYAGMSVSGVSVSGDTVNLSLAGTTVETGTGNLSLSLAGSTYTDTAGNAAGNFSNVSIADAAPPVIVSAATRDLDSDAKIDALYVTFSESVSDSSVNASHFSVSGYAPLSFNPTLSGDSANDRHIYLSLTETGSTSDTQATPQLVYTAGTLQDGRNNLLASRTLTASDAVAPKLLTRRTADTDGNGRIDRTVLGYSENLNSATGGISVSVEGYTVASYATSGTGLFVNLDEKTVPDSGAAPLVQVLSNTTIADSASNTVASEASGTAATDGTGPVIAGARYDERGAGTADDVIVVTFSEPVNAATISTSNAAADFVLSGGGSLGTNSTVSVTSSTTVEITLN